MTDDRLAAPLHDRNQHRDRPISAKGLAAIRRNLVLSKLALGPMWVHQVERLCSEVERLRGLLARLEWASMRPTGEDVCCPVCGEYPKYGHADCWLAAELGR